MNTPRHPFIDPDDTDWGRRQQRLHEENQERFRRIEGRMDAIWIKMDEADNKREAAREETKKKMEFLDDIHNDLRTAIALFRGAKATATLVGWVAGFGGAMVAIWQFVWPKR